MKLDIKQTLMILTLMGAGILSFNNFCGQFYYKKAMSDMEIDAAETFRLVNEKIRRDLESSAN